MKQGVGPTLKLNLMDLHVIVDVCNFWPGLRLRQQTTKGHTHENLQQHCCFTKHLLLSANTFDIYLAPDVCYM